MFKRFFAAFLIIAAFAALPTLAAHAATATYTITEAQVNEALNGKSYSRSGVTISAVSADFQPGVVVLSGSAVYQGLTFALVGTFEPSISNGRLNFKLTSATINGQKVPNNILTSVNSSLSRAVRSAIDTAVKANGVSSYKVESLTIGDSDATITVTYNR